MMPRRFSTMTLTSLLALLLVAPSAASAQEGTPDPAGEGSVDAPADPFKVSVGLGIKGGPQWQGATEVPEQITYRQGGQSYEYGDTNIYGQFGTGGGIGAVAEIRAQDIYGLETGFYATWDNSKGRNDVSEEGGEDLGAVTQFQDTKSFHVPVLLKLSPPFEKVRPTLGLGLEFVIQRESQLSYEYSGQLEDDPSRAVEGNAPLPSDRNTITTTNYTAFLATAGVEIDAGPVRIPIELRVAYNLGWNEAFDQRVHVENPKADDEQFVYNGEYLGHFGLWTGIEYRWDFAIE